MTDIIRKIKPTDKEYPEKLKVLNDMPASIYVRGALPDPSKKAVAIVGARACSSYGQKTAEYFAYVLAQHQISIISGMALGIDTAAHRGCLNAGGQTFAVFGCGVDEIYPRSNTGLCRSMLEKGGGVISEFEPGTPPLAYHFPIRNRLISALSDAVIIVEARRRSGSLITASYALEQGKQIYAVPGKLSDSLSLGTNDLIWQGAAPAISPEQILYDLGIVPKEKEENISSSASSCSADELRMLKLISFEPITVNELCHISKMNTSDVSGLLLSLELKGKIYSPVPGSYSRTYS